MTRRAVPSWALVALALVTGGCAAPAVTPSVDAAPSVIVSASPSATTPASTEPVPGDVEAAPGSDSAVYEPNPASIVVAIDAGHGGCLDWGVPDPSERGEQLAEKTLTLEIARTLEALLSAQGIGVVMIRDEDEALAGDNYPPLGCAGPPWRDVNGDGLAGFGPDLPEGTRTRDELQARLDFANVARADALVSIHINSPAEGAERIEIAFSETFYTDETPWGATATATLAEAMQSGVVERLDPIADYERGDRGITAHNFYLVAPPLMHVTPERPDPLAQPARGGLMPVVLAEVGSITLRSEHDLLASSEGQEAVAEGLLLGLSEYLGGRALAARISLADGPSVTTPAPVEGDGPLFWTPSAPDGTISLRLTNTGTLAWPSNAELVVGWAASDEPYLAVAPSELEVLPNPVPPLSPGESVVVLAELPSPTAASRSLAWITLMADGTTTADQGSPALQVASEP